MDKIQYIGKVRYLGRFNRSAEAFWTWLRLWNDLLGGSLFRPARIILLIWLLGSTMGLWTTTNIVNAQSLGWTGSASVLFDTEFSNGTEAGPGLSGSVTLLPNQTLSYFLNVTVARTDFPVGVDDLHRNWGIAAVGLRLARSGERQRVGISLGLGAVVFDDVSETDPGFRSSANAEEMLQLGVEGSIPLNESLHLRLALQDMVTGWWNAIIDPSEGNLNHRFQLSLGVEFR